MPHSPWSPRAWAGDKRIPAASAALFALNALLCLPLVRVEYLDNFGSNEGVFITLGRFVLKHWPHFGWVPWYEAGTPFENAYFSLVPLLVAAGAFVGRCSPAHAFHFLAALAYSAGPVFLFLFARKLSGRLAPSLGAALLWSLFSPAVLIPRVLNDLGSPWVSHRLKNIVYWGETPHQVALALLPLALFLVLRYLEKPGPARFAAAALAIAAVMLGNAFGMVVVCAAIAFLLAALKTRSWRNWLGTGAMLPAAYLAICRFLPPSLLELIRRNAPMAGGDYRVTTAGRVFEAILLLGLVALWAVARRFRNPFAGFSLLFFGCFGSIVLAGCRDVFFAPLPLRYIPEAEIGFCLLAASALEPAVRRLPRGWMAGAGALCGILAILLAAREYRFAQALIRPADIARSAAFRQARWIGGHLPGQRIMVSGENQYWFNLFAENPQMALGHESSNPNWMQGVAVYTIYSGLNAGDRDAAYSILWLKAFGCGAITVPGPGSADHYHPIVHPDKFDGLLPLIWREGGDSVYRVPLKSTSLAHVIPASAVVTRRPVHGLDVEQVRIYVAALEDPRLPDAPLLWTDPERGRIRARLGPGQALSVQITYDPGWRANIGREPARIRPDGLGMMILDGACPGECTIDLEYTGGTERKVCLALSALAASALLGALLWSWLRSLNPWTGARRKRVPGTAPPAAAR